MEFGMHYHAKEETLEPVNKYNYGVCDFCHHIGNLVADCKRCKKSICSECRQSGQPLNSNDCRVPSQTIGATRP